MCLFSHARRPPYSVTLAFWMPPLGMLHLTRFLRGGVVSSSFWLQRRTESQLGQAAARKMNEFKGRLPFCSCPLPPWSEVVVQAEPM